MRALGIDQATVSGWCAGDAGTTRGWAFGSFRMPKRDDQGERLVIFRDGLVDLIERYKPDIVAYEQVYQPVGEHNARKADDAKGPRFNVKTIGFLKNLEGVLIECTARHGIITHHYPSASWRVTALGMGRLPGAPAGELKRMMVRRAKSLGYDVKDDNEADAIGILMHELMGPPAAARQQGDLLEREVKSL